MPGGVGVGCVSDCHMFSSVNHGSNDHHLLVLSLQLHLKAFKHDVPTRHGLWDGALLRELGHRAAFGQEVGNHFIVLPSWACDPKEEWGRFVTTMSTVVAKTVGTQGLV